MEKTPAWSCGPPGLHNHNCKSGWTHSIRHHQDKKYIYTTEL